MTDAYGSVARGRVERLAVRAPREVVDVVLVSGQHADGALGRGVEEADLLVVDAAGDARAVGAEGGARRAVGVREPLGLEREGPGVEEPQPGVRARASTFALSTPSFTRSFSIAEIVDC